MRDAIASSALVFGAAALAGCGNGDPTGVAPTASASAVASALAASSSAPAPKEPRPPWIGVDGPVAPLQGMLDPAKKGPYSGPTATLRGTVTITGDAPPPTTLTFPKECGQADDVYGTLFRVGKGKALADALVAVTGFDAFVPARTEAVEVVIDRCAYDRRTVALALGQRLDVRSVDKETSYMPFLDGSEYSAMRVAMPAGAAVPLSTRKPGQYLLRDAMKRPFMLADVFVLKYATAAVTKIDGTYEIAGLPLGRVRVDVLLPIIRKTKGKSIELKEGDNVFDLELAFDAKVDKPTPVPPPEFGTRRQSTVGPPASPPAPSSSN